MAKAPKEASAKVAEDEGEEKRKEIKGNLRIPFFFNRNHFIFIY